MEFLPTTEMKVSLAEGQEKELCSREQIMREIQRGEVLAFDIVHQGILIGFAMLRPFEEGYFLWNFAIGLEHQNKGYGQQALLELFTLMKGNYSAKEIWTTYLWGNTHAKHVYEKAGFVETDVVDEDGIHEVNMVIRL